MVIPGGSGRSGSWIKPGFNATLNFQHITKHAETINTPDQIVPALRRAFSIAKNGRPGPVLIEVPSDMWNVEVAGELNYKPTKRCVTAPDPKVVEAAADALIKAKMPLIYAGQGVHYAKAWNELKAVAELLEAPVTTSLEGKSAFPETHPLSLGSGGVAMPRTVAAHVAGVRRRVRRRCQLHGHGLRHPLPDGEEDVHPQHDRCDGHRQEHPDANSAGGRFEAHARGAASRRCRTG